MRCASLAVAFAVGALAFGGLIPGLCATRDGLAQTAPDATAPSVAQLSAARPVPDAGVTGQNQCIDETEAFQTKAGRYFFVIDVANKCDKRLKCKIHVDVASARGPSSAETTLVLAPQSAGEAAKKTYPMRVKAPGGSAQVSRECLVY